MTENDADRTGATIRSTRGRSTGVRSTDSALSFRAVAATAKPANIKKAAAKRPSKSLKQTLHEAGDREQLNQVVVQYLSEMGFSHYIFRRREACSRLLSNLPQDLIDAYCIERFETDDFAIQHAGLITIPLYQSTIDSYLDSAQFYAALLNRNQMLSKLYRSFGFKDFYHLPVAPSAELGSSENNALFSVTIAQAGTEALQQQVALKGDELYELALMLEAKEATMLDAAR